MKNHRINEAKFFVVRDGEGNVIITGNDARFSGKASQASLVIMAEHKEEVTREECREHERDIRRRDGRKNPKPKA